MLLFDFDTVKLAKSSELIGTVTLAVLDLGDNSSSLRVTMAFADLLGTNLSESNLRLRL